MFGVVQTAFWPVLRHAQVAEDVAGQVVGGIGYSVRQSWGRNGPEAGAVARLQMPLLGIDRTMWERKDEPAGENEPGVGDDSSGGRFVAGAQVGEGEQ